jgi:uncharacterized protein involved in type VI secretion and phage assembly
MAKEIYKAIVSRVNDDKKLGRIKVNCDGLAAHGKELPYWIEPIYPIAANGWGWFYVPEVGDEVEIEITIHDHTDETHGESIVSNPDIRYRAGAYSPGQKVPDELKKNYGQRIGLKTRAGHLLIFDDKEGSEEITITAGAGNVNINAGAGATVNINGSEQSLVRGEDLKAWCETHTHGTPVGPSSTPVQPFTPTILSKKGKLS